MLRSVCFGLQGGLDEQLPLIEFLYNNSYHPSIGMAPYKALYGSKCKTPLCWQDIDISLTIGPNLIQATTDKIRAPLFTKKQELQNPKPTHSSPFNPKTLIPLSFSFCPFLFSPLLFSLLFSSCGGNPSILPCIILIQKVFNLYFYDIMFKFSYLKHNKGEDLINLLPNSNQGKI